MFSPFKTNGEEMNITDKVWISEEQKWKACVEAVKNNFETYFICWFDETYEKLKTVFNINGQNSENIILARQANWQHLKNKSIIFTEHYPLKSKEEELYVKLNLQEAIIYSSLDEPLFKQFGGDKIIPLMKQLGMKEDENVEHSLITSSITKAQENISSKVLVEISATSQADWLIKNLLA